jgi:hypothetical protein
MADPLTISGAIASLKTAGEIAGAFVGLRDQAIIQTKVIELQTVILAAQQSALSAQGEQFALLEEKRDLEAQIAHLEAWGREKERYQLQEIGRGSFAYVLKPDAHGSEPAHMICPNCYQHGRKSLLQATDALALRQRVHRCPACRTEVAGNLPPAQPLPPVPDPGAV